MWSSVDPSKIQKEKMSVVINNSVFQKGENMLLSTENSMMYQSALEPKQSVKMSNVPQEWDMGQKIATSTYKSPNAFNQSVPQNVLPSENVNH